MFRGTKAVLVFNIECQQDNELHNEEPCLLIKGHMLMY